MRCEYSGTPAKDCWDSYPGSRKQCHCGAWFDLDDDAFFPVHDRLSTAKAKARKRVSSGRNSGRS
jgi:hypothetical protein